MGAPKTNAIRLLEARGIAFQTTEYEYREESQGAVAAAELLGVPPEQVFKTLVTRNARQNLYIFCLPGNATLNLKKAARVAGAGPLEMLPQRDLQPLTGYVHGGCSPIGMKKPYPVWIDELATAMEWLYINGGRRGLQIRLAPADLAAMTGGSFADLT